MRIECAAQHVSMHLPFVPRHRIIDGGHNPSQTSFCAAIASPPQGCLKKLSLTGLSAFIILTIASVRAVKDSAKPLITLTSICRGLSMISFKPWSPVEVSEGSTKLAPFLLMRFHQHGAVKVLPRLDLCQGLCQGLCQSGTPVV